jgi:hypothetical protein
VKIVNDGLSRMNLMVIVYEVMNMRKKTFEGLYSPTCEILLVDTLMAKGFRQIDFSKSEQEE